MKRIVMLLLAAVMAIGVSACTSSEAQKEEPKQEAAAGSTKEAVTKAETKTETKTEAEAPTEASYKDTIDEIVICYLPNEASEEYAEYRSMMEEDMSAALGVKVTEVNAADYNAVVEAMRTGKADIANFGPVSYVQAAERSGAEALVSPAAYGDKSKAGYTSKIIVKAGSDIKTIEDLKGRTFAFVDPSSTSGNYVPTLELMTKFPELTNEDFHTNGTFFASVIFSGKHQNGLQSVLNGDIDAAPIASDILDAEMAAGRVKEEDIVVIHESPVIPASPMAIKGDLPEDLKSAVKDFLLNYKNEDYFQYMLGMAPEEEAAFVEAADSDYDYVRDLMAKVIPEE